jgi:hypothetical protein
MQPTTMMDFQCVNFRVEGEPEAETTKGRGGDKVSISEEEGRGRASVEGRDNQVLVHISWTFSRPTIELTRFP